MTDASTTSDNIVDEEEEDELLVEPRFRYTRVLGNLVKVLDSGAASSFALHDKFLAVGFQSGRICFYDHMGNESLFSATRYHKCAVSCISIDGPGNYFISCANDFTINIFGIGCTEYNQRMSLPYSAKVVAIASDFSRHGSNQRFIVGSRNLVLYERGIRAELFSGKRRETVLYEGLERDGLISAIDWNGHYVAFTNETGTRIYDMKVGRSLTLVQPFHNMEECPIGNYPPKLSWLSTTNLAIGWANTVCVCAIQTGLRRYSNNGGPSFELPVKHGQLLHKFILPDFFIAGLSFNPINSEELGLQLQHEIPINSPSNSIRNLQLTSNSSDDSKLHEIVVFGMRAHQKTDQLCKSEEPKQCALFSSQLLLLRPNSLQDYTLVAEDTIEMRNVDIKLLHSFTMCSIPADHIYFLMSAREIIEAIPCSVDDRIGWLMENGFFEEALECALRNNDSLREHSMLDVGKKLISHLIDQKNYDLAAHYLPRVCTHHKVEWEFYVNEFERHNQILKLVSVLPTEDPQLEPECYESILLAALYTRPKLFNAIVSHWNADIYRAHSIRDEVFARITVNDKNKNLKSVAGKEVTVKVLVSEEDRCYILRGLATLLLQLQDYENALKTYLLLGDPAIFGIINRHKLFPYLVNQVTKRQVYIKQLMEINQTLSIRLLLDNEDLLPHDEVIKLLGHDPKIQMNYLMLLQTRGEGLNYSDQLVKLLSEHKREALLQFLRKNEYYRLDYALDVCKRKDYVEEMVYLLGRSGNRIEALDLMMNKLKRIEMAIDFCAEDGDNELWQRLIESAINHPDHVARLLCKTASVNINPLDIIEKVPQNMVIPGLRNSLLQVLRDYELQIGLLEYSNNIASSDAFQLLLKRLKPTTFMVNNHQSTTELRCAICSAPLCNVSMSSNANGDIRLLPNGTAIHNECANSFCPMDENHTKSRT